MATLQGNKVKDTYTSLLKLDSNGVTSSLKVVEDGAGTDSALKLSTSTVEVNGTLSFTTAPPTNSSELTALLVDGSNNVVKRELDSTAFLAGAVNTFQTIAVSGQTSVVADSSTDTLTLAEGTGIDITTNSSTDTITIANSSNAFKTIAVSGQTSVVADAVEDTLTLAAGSGMTITTTASSDTVTFSSNTVYANPMYILRPNTSYALTPTPATPTSATVNNNDKTKSHLVNANSQLSTSTTTNSAVTVVDEGLIKIDVNFFVEITGNDTDVIIDIKSKPSGGSTTSLQGIKREHDASAASAISFSFVHYATDAEDIFYEISKGSGASQSGSLLTSSTFIITKLD